MQFDIITFDCYGTLIDWESGISQAIRDAARQDGVDIAREEILRVYHQVEPTVQAAEYRPYRDVLRHAATETAARLGWALSPRRAGFLAESLSDWAPFPETNAALERLVAEGYRLGILSNVDDDLLAATLRHFTVDFDILVTAAQVRSYKPAPAHFVRARELIGGQRWLHVAQSYFHDVEPACELQIPVVWVNRKGERPSGTARPTAEAETLEGLVDTVGSERATKGLQRGTS